MNKAIPTATTLREVQPVRLALGLFLLMTILGVLPFLRDTLSLSHHEADTIQLADMVLRMALYGQLPHIDFMTPIGIFALWPIAFFVKSGMGLGHAFLAAQLAIASVLFLPALRVALSRFHGISSWAIAAYILALCVALNYGGNHIFQTSIAMYYNRWSFALVYIAVPLAMLSSHGRQRPVLDGILIGLALSGMAMIKITFFIALVPGIIGTLLMRRQSSTLLALLLSGTVIIAILTYGLGISFWFSYLHDLITVATSANRAAPGNTTLAITLCAPSSLGETAVLLAGIIFLRQARRRIEGNALLILAPGFIYITYQNYGNDPQWLLLLTLLLSELQAPSEQINEWGWPLRNAMQKVAIAAFAFALPSLINIIWSPVAEYFWGSQDMVPLIPKISAKTQDIHVFAPRLYHVSELITPDRFLTQYTDRAHPPTPVKLNGETLPLCELRNGFNAWLEEAAHQLEQAGYSGEQIMTADLFPWLWLYGDFPPPKGAAPWYYGGAPGLKNAQKVLVPFCANDPASRNEILTTIQGKGWSLHEELRTDLFILLTPAPSPQGTKSP